MNFNQCQFDTLVLILLTYFLKKAACVHDYFFFFFLAFVSYKQSITWLTAHVIGTKEDLKHRIYWFGLDAF